MFNLSVKGLDKTITKLKKLSKAVPKAAEEVTLDESERILKRIKLYTPVYTTALEKASKYRVMNTGPNSRTVRFYLETSVSVVNPDTGKTITVNVHEYARRINESYGTMNPGPYTKAKRSANPGVYIGERFMERGVKDSKKPLIQRLKRRVKEEIAKVDL